MAEARMEARQAARLILQALGGRGVRIAALWGTCARVAGNVATVRIDGDDHDTECRMLSGASGLAAGKRCRIVFMGQEPLVQDYVL